MLYVLQYCCVFNGVFGWHNAWFQGDVCMNNSKRLDVLDYMIHL